MIPHSSHIPHTSHTTCWRQNKSKMTPAQMKDDFLLKHMQILSNIDRENKKILSPEHSQYLYFTELHIESSQRFPLTNTQTNTLKIKFVRIPKGSTWEMSGK